MSATDELRKLLDRRGVEYETEDRKTVSQTYWGDWCFMEPLDAEPHTIGAQCELMCIPATPEQAIAATLGERTCRKIIPNEENGYVFCSECGAEIGEYNVPNYCHMCGAKVVEE